MADFAKERGSRVIALEIYDGIESNCLASPEAKATIQLGEIRF
jgi:hypothetical protein